MPSAGIWHIAPTTGALWLGPASCPAPPFGGPPSLHEQRDGAGDLVAGRRFSVETVHVHSPGAVPVMLSDVKHAPRLPQCHFGGGASEFRRFVVSTIQHNFCSWTAPSPQPTLSASDADDADFRPASPWRIVRSFTTGTAFNRSPRRREL